MYNKAFLSPLRGYCLNYVSITQKITNTVYKVETGWLFSFNLNKCNDELLTL